MVTEHPYYQSFMLVYSLVLFCLKLDNQGRTPKVSFIVGGKKYLQRAIQFSVMQTCETEANASGGA